MDVALGPLEQEQQVCCADVVADQHMALQAATHTAPGDVLTYDEVEGALQLQIEISVTDVLA